MKDHDDLPADVPVTGRDVDEAPLPPASLPDEDPIEAVTEAVEKDEDVPIRDVEPGVDPDSAASSRALRGHDEHDDKHHHHGRHEG